MKYMNKWGMEKINWREIYQKKVDGRQTEPRKDDEKMTNQVTKKEMLTKNQESRPQPSSLKMKPNQRSSCFGCGLEGHYKRNCPEVYCFYCGKRGHMKKCCSFYSSYLSTRTSLNSSSEAIYFTEKKLENSKMKIIEEVRDPQKKDDYLLMKEFNSYKARVEKSLKELEAALLSLKKNSEALTVSVGKTESTVKNLKESHVRLEEDHIGMACAYDKSRRDLDIAFDRVKNLEDFVFSLQRDCEFLPPSSGGVGRNRPWR